MQGVIDMPTLQVRDLPEDIYIKLNMIANEENRSIAQQTIVLLKESLGLHVNNKLRRKALLEKIGEKNYFLSNEINQVELIREDRER
jgi:antitoxin FitA